MSVCSSCLDCTSKVDGAECHVWSIARGKEGHVRTEHPGGNTSTYRWVVCLKGSVDAEGTDNYDLMAYMGMGTRDRWVEGVISAYLACCLLDVMDSEVPE